MDYKDVRKKFIELCGRYDLVNPDWSDNGADFFLNAGQQYLDRKQNTGKMIGKNVQAIAAGTIKVYIPGLRTVYEVWVGESVDGLVRLDKVPLSVLRDYYGEQLSGVTQSSPLYYAPVSFRPFTDVNSTTTWSGYYDIDDLILPTGSTPLHYQNTGVIIMPPPDQTYYVSIYGLFYSPTLSATVASGVWTQTKSFWSECFPDLLIRAGLFRLEQFYRNREGAKDWQNGVLEDLDDMNKDAAEEEAADINQMEG